MSSVNKTIEMSPEPHYQHRLPPIRATSSVNNLSDAVDSKADLSKQNTGSYNILNELPAMNMAKQLLRPSCGDDFSDSGTTVASEATSIGGVCPFTTAMLLESYEAESPDEMALVKTACHYGWKLCQRGSDFVSVWIPGELSL